uniref:Ribosomal protein n=1 Tax=Aquila chrysaetos chrysaetos TaxID=223781 RepID=A0A663DTR4_AQUCH
MTLFLINKPLFFRHRTYLCAYAPRKSVRFHTASQTKRHTGVPLAAPAAVSPRAPPLWCGAAAPRASLLALSPPPGLLLLPPPPVLFAGLKTKTSLKRRCKDCFIVRRRGRLYVLCKTNPRHKQRKL